MKKFMKELWRYTGIWANPFRTMYRESMYREAKWKHYVNEIRFLSQEMDCPDVEAYCDHVLEQMKEE